MRKPRKHYSLGITLKDTNKLIGGCGIHESNPDNKEGWIGYCLNREYWHEGYATETAKALIAFGFKRLRLHRIFATCDPANKASAHVLEKVRMQCEGHLRQHRWAKRRWRDSLLYAILDQEWKRFNASQK
jgi:[ribosomal protein S5]-alanine N-acetyltransferase